MSFQLPLTGVIALPQTVPAQAVGGIERLRQILPVGTILDLLVATDPHGNPSLNLAGQFFSAALPPNVKTGERITVEVLEHNEMLLLKLLEHGAPAIAGRSRDLESKLFQAIIKAVLPELSPTDLLTTPPALENLPPQFAKLAESRTAAPPAPANTASPPIMHKLETALRQLIDESFILSDHTFVSPQKLESAIKHAALPVPERLRDIIRFELKSAEQTVQQQPRVRFLRALEEYIGAAIDSPDADTAALPKSMSASSSKQSTETRALQPSVKDLQIYTEASLMALETSDARALKVLSAALRTPESPEHPILILIKTLSAFLPEEQLSAKAGDDKTFAELVRAVVVELKQLHDLHTPEKDPKEALTKAKQLVENLRKQYAGSETEIESKTEAHAILRNMEQLHGAKEALAQLNPLMQSIGQPQYHLIPSIHQGCFGAWEVLASKIRIEDEEEKKRRDKQHGADQVSVRLPLPAMGQVQLDLRNHGGELYINIGLGDGDAAAFVSERLPQLQKKLEEGGFIAKHLGAKTVDSEPLLPQWYRELVKNSVIA
ncbi:MAG: flagellar hook-length control protein FliK [Oligoflexia bacterium]|nr:flagellar hook-length control protein FliK [Oligoflexia bacterium]